MTTTESQITSGKAESIDTPEFREKLNRVLFCAGSQTFDAIAALIAHIEAVREKDREEAHAVLSDRCNQLEDANLALLDRAQAAEAELKAITERQAAGLAKLAKYSREMRGGHHGRIGFEDFYAVEDVVALLSPAQQEPAKEESAQQFALEEIEHICDAYESGIGHGLQRDGHNDGKAFANPDLGNAYVHGYQVGEDRAKEAASANDPAKCWCSTCRPVTPFGNPEDNRMVLCPTCGNKRCPHANDHRNACTNSNEPGQPGSGYPAASATDASEAITITDEAITMTRAMLVSYRNEAFRQGIAEGRDKAAAPAQATPEGGQAHFAEWFIKNYPTDTIIQDPAWHARSIYRAALAAS